MFHEVGNNCYENKFGEKLVYSTLCFCSYVIKHQIKNSLSLSLSSLLHLPPFLPSWKEDDNINNTYFQMGVYRNFPFFVVLVSKYSAVSSSLLIRKEKQYFKGLCRQRHRRLLEGVAPGQMWDNLSIIKNTGGKEY